MIIDDNNPANGDFDDDDSFALENLDKYPGDLAAFVDVTPSKKEGTNAISNTSVSNEDFLSETDTTEATMENSTHTPHESTPIDDESSFQSNLRGLEGATLGAESGSAMGETMSESADTVSDEDDIDTDDFVRQLQADLARSKAKKEAQSSQSEAVKVAEPVKKIEFTSVEELPGTQEIDLSSIAAHHPSTYLQMEEAEEVPAIEALPEESDSGYSGYAQMAASMPAQEPAIPETPAQNEPAQKKQKKNRKGLYLLVAASMAILALGFGAYTFYPQLSQMLGSHPVADSTHAEAPKKVDAMPHRPPQKNNYMSIAERVEANRRTDSLRQIAELQKAAEEKAPEVKEPQKEIVKAEPPKPKPVAQEVPKKQEVVKAEPKPVAKEPKPPTIARNNSAPPTSEAKPQVYTVQVYSSPSKDDADERLTRLKSKNATNATISEQTIRGQKWYRVRFGAFASRDEAEAAAKQLGFTQCWIDRVR